ncbi:MAG: M15 family metallopeptidase [Candidatus Berkiella sp.]
MADLPQGFVKLASIAPDLVIDLKYCYDDNLIGRPLLGYAPDGEAIMTLEAAKALGQIAKALQSELVKNRLSMTDPTLVVWDTYRPQMACDDFWEWSQSDCAKTKKDYYPNIDKKDFFKLGYIAHKSSHSRGSTVDLNIVDKATGHFLDMGTRFDYMDLLSHPANTNVTDKAFANRQFLKQLMLDHGYVGIEQEWWHFTYANEIFPDTYFNFPVIKY